MRGFEVGDKVKIVSKGRSSDAKNYNGETVTISEIKHNIFLDEYYVLIKEHDTHGIWLDELEGETLPDIVERTKFMVNIDDTSVQYEMGAKRDRVILMKQGYGVGYIKYKDIDRYITLLETLRDKTSE